MSSCNTESVSHWLIKWLLTIILEKSINHAIVVEFNSIPRLLRNFSNDASSLIFLRALQNVFAIYDTNILRLRCIKKYQEFSYTLKIINICKATTSWYFGYQCIFLMIMFYLIAGFSQFSANYIHYDNKNNTARNIDHLCMWYNFFFLMWN